MPGILIWNCRGARKKETANHLRCLCDEYGPSIIALVETQLESIDRRDADRILGRQWEFVMVPSEGRSGGMAIFWLPSKCSISMVSSSRQVAICNVCMVDGLQWMLGVVYASKSYHFRRDIWASLSQVIGESLPFLVGGDFNCILSQDEKKGGKRFTYSAASREFEEFMILNGLIDAGFEGPAYTWCNNNDVKSRIWVRQDRILLNSCAAIAFPGFRVQHLLRVSSDHCPLLFTANTLNFLNMHRLIRFEDAWLGFPESYGIVERVWTSRMRGSAACRVARKCFRSLGELRKWNGNRFSSLSVSKKQLEDRIQVIQAMDTSVAGISQEDLVELRQIHYNLTQVEGLIATWWRQRAKVKWVEEGERNTTFFHMSATARRRANRILHLEDENGSSCNSQPEIMSAFVSFFQRKWMSRGIAEDDFPISGYAVTLSDEQQVGLTRQVSEVEIRDAVFSLGKGRSPGIDGVTGTFFQGFWRSVGKEVTAAILQFFRTGVMPPKWKQTLIVLIPKKEHPCTAADYHLIFVLRYTR